MQKEVTEKELDPKRWRALIVIAIAQLMVVLDSSIVNIAIPSAKIDLGISSANQQWVHSRLRIPPLARRSNR